MDQISLRVVGLFGLTLLAAAMAASGTAGCGSSGGGAGTGGTAGTGTGGATTTGTGGATSVGTGGTTSPGTGGAVAATGGTTGTGGATPATGGTTGTGGAAAATGGRSGTGGAAAATGGRTGTGGAPGGGGAGGQGGRGTLTLTSAMLANGGTFLPANTCAGVNQSPALTWTAGPAGTMSYAIVMVDTDITRYHWAIWNMATTVMSLPEALPAGAAITTPVSAMQAITGAATPVYQGPCPNGNVHTYVLTVYALDVATVPGLATGVMAQAVFTAIQSHILASGTLSGTSNAVRAP